MLRHEREESSGFFGDLTCLGGVLVRSSVKNGLLDSRDGGLSWVRDTKKAFDLGKKLVES